MKAVTVWNSPEGFGQLKYDWRTANSIPLWRAMRGLINIDWEWP